MVANFLIHLILQIRTAVTLDNTLDLIDTDVPIHSWRRLGITIHINAIPTTVAKKIGRLHFGEHIKLLSDAAWHSSG